MVVTKDWLQDYLEDLEDDEEIDLGQIERDYAEERERYIEDLEERQHDSGFYSFQDTLWMYRRERQKGE